MIRWFEHRQVYIPTSSIEAEAQTLGRPAEDVYFKTSDSVRLNGWFFPADASSPRKDLALLLFHGNAGNISHRFGIYSTLLEIGLNVFAVDYRGYGRSEGTPDEAGTYLDAEAAYDWLRAKGFAPSTVVALGHSLGGGIASELSLRREVGGLILLSTFCSVPEIGKDLYPFLPVRWLASIAYDTLSKLPRIKVPVMVMHSPADEVVPFKHGERNFAAANEPKLFWELSGGHNTTLQAGRDRFIEGMNKYLTSYL